MKNLEELQKQGYRLTQPRQEILKTLKEYPQTVQEIHSSLKKKRIKINLASVYRSLELFVTMGIVSALDLGEDKKRYELIDEKNHHHHLVCNSCGKIEDIRLNEQKFIKEVAVKSQFLVDHHHLEFFGYCSNCQ